MRIAFSRNNCAIGSFIIRWGISDGLFSLAPASHFIVIFDEKLVLHSNLHGGVHVESLESFVKSSEVVESFRLKNKLKLEDEEAIYQTLVHRIVGKAYDFAALFYISWRVFLKKFFKKPMPETNPWNLNDQFFCVETISELNKVLCERTQVRLFSDLEASIVDPFSLLQRMRENILVERC